MSKKTVKVIGAVTMSVLLLTVAFVALPTLAQEGDGVTTPEPQADGDYDCDQFETREQVNAVFDPDNDEYGLDNDDDGIACENVGEPSEDNSTDTPTDDQTTTDTEDETTEDTTTDDQQEQDDDQQQDEQTADQEDTDMKEDTDKNKDKKEEPPC